jgi:integrase|tara:strand:+ start:4971 stop:6116 length:1146 start_codon:yes stop_codon:yes gene_type:complete
MASLRKMNKTYFSRVVWKDDYGSLKEKAISLKTDKKSEAIIRNNAVEKVEDLIRQGENAQFPWMSEEGGKIKFIRKTVHEAIEEFLSIKSLDGLRGSTMRRYKQSLDLFTSVVGDTLPIDRLDDSYITSFRKYSKNVKNHSNTTMGIHLQKIKSFVIFAYDKKWIKEPIKIQIKYKTKKPMYLSEWKLKRLFASDVVPLHYRKAFYFYAQTGCRLSEPFDGEVDGRWLKLSEDVFKTNIAHQYQLNKYTLPILLEMRDNVERNIGVRGHGSKGYTRRWMIKKYSKMFKKIAKAENFGQHCLKHLRDTYAVRRWAVTGDIKTVADELGHTSINTTLQNYAKIKPRVLMDDFETLKPILQARLGKDTYDTELHSLMNTPLQIA